MGKSETLNKEKGGELFSLASLSLGISFIRFRISVASQSMCIYV